MQMLMDRSAIALSTMCAIHCLFLPVVIVVLPALATTSLANESFHHLLLWFVFPISALALTQGCRHHKDRKVLTFGILGLALLIGSAIVGHEFLTEEVERVATVLGATSLAFGHFRNYRLCRKKNCNL
ncbi:MerC domain-containing protein [Nostoc sp. UHCC 0702]|nr:MerC domain-containing protein [Nostoc sp. UHCC 0702]